MKKEGVISLFLISILLFSPFVSAYSITGRAIDDVRMIFANDEGKVNIALEVREKEINSAIESAKVGNTEEAIKLLEDAKKKLEIVQDKISPEVVEEVQKNIEEIKKKLSETGDIPPEFEGYIKDYMIEEEKTSLSASLSEKLFNYCTELANQDYETMLKDEKCKSENAPVWLKDKVDEKINDLKENASEKILEVLTNCINDPRDCDCSKIPAGNAETKCEESKALAIKCEFQEDKSACTQLNNIDLNLPSNIPKFLQPFFKQKLNDAIGSKEKEMFNKFAPKECIEAKATTREECEKIMFEKNAPRECIEAGATTKEACEKIMNGIYGPPPTECMENGEFIGPEACDDKMVKSGRIPQECIKDSKPLPPEDCNQIMQEKGMMNKPDLNTIPKECIKNGEAVLPEECQKIMEELGIAPPGGKPGEMQGNIPQECMQNGQPISPEECNKIMEEKGIVPQQQGGDMMSGECREKGITDFYECQKIVNMPRPCKDSGIYDSSQCEEKIMSQNIPRECVEANALTPNSCRQIMLPQECKNSGASSWEDCEAIRIRQQMPAQCQREGELNIEDCAKTLAENVIASSPGSEMDFLNRRGIKQNEIPGVCMSGSNFIRGMDCDKELAQMGITLPAPSDASNIPSECVINGVPVSPQECELTLKNKLVNENIPAPCRESGITDSEGCGRLMENERRQEGLGMNVPQECIGLSPDACREIMKQKGIEVREPVVSGGDLPKECAEFGVSDSNSCDMVMSKINEERMKNGEKLIVDQDGNQDYITPAEIKQIIKETEQNVETQPNFEAAEQSKQQVEYYEQKIEKIEQVQTEPVPSGEQGAPSGGENSGGEGASSGGESGGGGSSSGGESSSGAGGGESAPTGEAIRQISSTDNFLTRFLERIFG